VVGELQGRGVNARGEVGDAEPLHAIEDALVNVDAREILLRRIRRGARTGSRRASQSGRRSASSSPYPTW
jgi:hypothetical protein